MTPQECWSKYKRIHPDVGDDIDTWQFGAKPDLLADLVVKGIKTATASAYDLYDIDNDPIPQVGSCDVILNSQDETICIVQFKQVTFLPFKDGSADHAYITKREKEIKT